MRSVVDSDPPDGGDIPAPGGLASRWHLSTQCANDTPQMRRAACTPADWAWKATLCLHVLWENPKQHPRNFLQNDTWGGGLWLAETRGRHLMLTVDVVVFSSLLICSNQIHAMVHFCKNTLQQQQQYKYTANTFYKTFVVRLKCTTVQNVQKIFKTNTEVGYNHANFYNGMEM